MSNKNFEVKHGLSVGGTQRISSAGVGTFTDLNVTGTTTTIDTATLQVQDKNIVINYGSGDTSSTASGAGITIQDAVNSSTDATLLWDASADEFDFSHTVTAPSLTIAGNATFDTSTLVVDSSNNRVGIGTASPQDKLHVYDGDVGIENSSGRRYRLIAEANGGFTIRDQTASSSRLAIDTSGNVQVGASSVANCLIGNDGNSINIKSKKDGTDAIPLTFMTQASGGALAERMRIDGSGNVGIGTNNPGQKLEVAGNIDIGSNSVKASMIGRSATSSADANINFWDYNHATFPGHVHIVADSAGSDGSNYGAGQIVFWTHNGSAFNTSGAFDKNGNLGIGTTNPTLGKLQVMGGGASNFSTLHLQSDTSTQFNHSINAFNSNLTNGENNLIVFGKEGSTKNSAWVGYKWRSAGSDTNQLTFGHWGNNNVFNILGNGYVGIGTESPAKPLSVHGNVEFRTTGTDGNEERINWNVGGASDAPSQTMYGADGATAKVLFHAGGPSYFTGGNLGVGDNSPAYRLELPNTASSAGQVRANAYQTYSDSRIKSNIQTLSYGLDIVKQLKPSQYKHHNSIKEDGQFVKQDEGANDIGFIAQEVLPLIPEVVSVPVDTDKDLYSISYPKLTAVLTKAIQEQQTIIEDLKARIETLEG